MFRLHTVVVSFHRLDETKQAIHSYLSTVSLPYSLMVVDNGSGPDVVRWLCADAEQHGYGVIALDRNYYPGYACNRGWEHAPAATDLLHRADNDFRFLPGWCDEVTRMFQARPALGQLGLRTDEEELFAPINVGGNCVIRKAVWDGGLRYDERPWKDYPPGHTEDSFFTPLLKGRGWTWDRVEKPCIEGISSVDLDDPYYHETFRVRRILPEQL